MNPIASTSAPPTSFPTSIDLDFLTLAWSIGSSGIGFSAKIEMGPLKWSKSFDLTYAHPSVSLSTPSIAHYSASLTVSFDDATGKLSVAAKVTWWAFGDHDKKVSHDLEILPPYILGLVAQGCRFPEILDEADAIAQAALDYNKLGAIKDAIRRAAKSAGISVSAACDFIKGHGQLINATLHAAPNAALCSQLAHVPSSALVAGLHAVVNDPRIQAQYPGIQNKLTFPAGYSPDPRVGQARATTATSAADIIVTILETVAELVGIAVAVLGAFAVLIGAILGILLLPVTASALAVGAAIFALIAAVVLLGMTLFGAAAAVVALIIKGILYFTD